MSAAEVYRSLVSADNAIKKLWAVRYCLAVLVLEAWGREHTRSSLERAITLTNEVIAEAQLILANLQAARELLKPKGTR